MSEQSSNKKTLIFMSILGLIVMAVLAYVFTRPAKTSMVTELYKYYPQNTAFYMEIQPGDNLSTRFFENIDKIRTISNSKHNEIELASLVKKNFKPLFSLGAWKTQQQTGTSASEPSFLMVVPLKDGVTMETLVADVKAPLDTYAITKQQELTFMESKASSEHPVMAIHNNHLLVAKSKETLQDAVKEWKTPSSPLDNPLYKKYMHLLPEKRQGTVLTLSQELQAFSPENMQNNQDKTFQKISQFQKQMQAATPVMVGGISIENERFIHFNSFTPVQLENIKDATFKKDMQALLTKEGSFDLASFLPKETVAYGGMVGLGSYYDMYINHIADEEGKKAIENVKNQLKMMGLDLRKNIVALLDGESAIGIVAKKGQPDVLLFFNSNEEIQKTLEQFGTMVAGMSNGKMTDKQIGPNQVVKVLESSAIPVKVGYSKVQPDSVVLGTQEGLENMYAVHQKKQPSLNDNKLFKELASDMPKNASGVFFVDFNQGASLIDELADKSPVNKKSEEKQFKEFISGIEGIAGSNTIDKKMMMHGNISIKLAAEEAKSD